MHSKELEAELLGWQGDWLESQEALGCGVAAKRVLGIDPGTRVMGFGVIEGDGRGTPRLVAAGSYRVARAGGDYERLLAIRTCIRSLVERYRPRDAAIESPFCGKNAQSMLKLGRAQGVAIATLVECGLAVQEYAPRKVKVSVTGRGEATKEQVKMVLSSLCKGAGIEALEDFDSSDALAVAFCHYYEGRVVGHTGKGSWSDFAARHPGRVRG